MRRTDHVGGMSTYSIIGIIPTSAWVAMQNPEQVPVLSVAVVVTAVSLLVIYRAALRTRRIPAIFYAVAITAFSGMALDLLLDQTFLPFRRLRIIISGQTLWASNLLLTIFIIVGYLAWYLAIIYSEFEHPPRRTFLVAFLAGGALTAEIERAEWSLMIPLTLEITGFAILTLEIANYARKVIRNVKTVEERKKLATYFVGFIVWIMAGPVGVVGDVLDYLGTWIKVLWVLPYSIGLLLVSVSVALNPRLLFVSEVRVRDYLVLDNEGTLIFTHRFVEDETSTDIELLGSAFSGIISLMKEMLSAGRPISGIDHGDAKVMIERGPQTTHVLVATRETPSLRQALRNLVLEFEANFREALQEDRSLTIMFEPFRERVTEVLG